MGRIGLFVCLLCLITACSPTATAVPTLPPGAPTIIAPASRLLNTDEALPQPGEPAPDFEFTRADGSTQRLSDLQGKKVVLNFWATWCTPCRDEMPALSQAASEQPDTLVVLGVNKNESVAKIATFAEEIPVVFPLIANPDGTISERYRISAIPVTYFIHTDGTIALRHTGVLDYAKLQEQLANVR